MVLGHAKSDWLDVTSGVPQGSLLGPLLFVIYINDLPEMFSGRSSLYADDCKIYCIFYKLNEKLKKEHLQDDINSLVKWCSEWSMNLNTEKCEVMHIGRNNPRTDYNISKENVVHKLTKASEQKDLGVLVNPDMKWCKQICASSARANRILGQVLNGFSNHDSNIIKKMYTSLVRPHLEYAVSVWNPYLKKDIDTLERVQRRATRSIKVFGELNMERLKRLNLTTLSTRRRCGEVHK